MAAHGTLPSVDDQMTSSPTQYWLRPTGSERIPTTVHARASDVSVAVATEIAELIRARAAEGRHCVLGLATGSTPTRVYDELVRLHRDEGLSFANVVTFNLDEYFPMKQDELQSYRRFMNEYLFDLIDIDPANVHVPDGTIAPEEVRSYCDHYEEMIREAGGVDLQILGIGRTGHIGFNEPGSGRDSRTRLIALDKVTRTDAASDFFGEENVPARAITMGVGTILDARRLVMMAFGEGKSNVVRQAVEGEVTPTIAASFLQEHPNARVHLDLAAAADLTRCKSPWVSQDLTWTEALTRKATIWLARKIGKPILKLTREDYNENHLQDLLAERGGAYDINLEVFRALQKTITGWPGGKPEARRRDGDIVRSGDDVFPKRVLIFSPHPDDDVISMGGTLLRLVDQGHEVHVAYQVSGSIAVFDAAALRFADFAADFNATFDLDGERAEAFEDRIGQSLLGKSPGEVDSPEVQKLKGLIRRGEARAAGRYCGVPDENLHFLDMPFYETGRVKKKPLSDRDVEIVSDLLRTVMPHQVYAAGDLSDPHGTHRTCLDAIVRSWERVRGDEWARDTSIWLYRGAWQEWDVDRLEKAVPLSPDELKRKINAIYKHESQKDKALFPGPDVREFWERAEQRNRNTARVFDELGLAEYEAIEAFVRWDGHSPLD
jgi:glucosamine-6-phosphate deaminase